MMIGTGLIGFGASGRTFHAPVIHAVPGMRLAAILQRSGNDAAKLYPNASLVRSMEEMLTLPEISLVVIATSNTSHYPLARQCLLAGKHVVVDKPFTTTLKEAEELIKLAAECNRMITVYQNSRWHGDFFTVRKLIASGTLGKLARYEAHFDRFRAQLRPGAWREASEPGSGLLFDLGPHLIDQALLLFGAPDRLTADVRREREGAIADDAFDVVLHYGEFRAVLGASMLAASPGPRFLLYGTHGSFVKYGADPQAEAIKLGEIPGGDRWGEEPEAMWGKLSLAKQDAITTDQVPTEPGDYRGYYANVRDAILGKAALDVTPQQALDLMYALELAQESNRRGCTLEWEPAFSF
jgi:scyllo-inositol 2-dehydrogenase (NADP+)